uniref:Uncharacterized protein n=1 Tax=Glossina pallidipes TaxID=7398 RepID=A0A1B0AGR4_GLOPL
MNNEKAKERLFQEVRTEHIITAETCNVDRQFTSKDKDVSEMANEDKQISFCYILEYDDSKDKSVVPLRVRDSLQPFPMQSNQSCTASRLFANQATLLFTFSNALLRAAAPAPASGYFSKKCSISSSFVSVEKCPVIDGIMLPRSPMILLTILPSKNMPSLKFRPAGNSSFRSIIKNSRTESKAIDMYQHLASKIRQKIGQLDDGADIIEDKFPAYVADLVYHEIQRLHEDCTVVPITRTGANTTATLLNLFNGLVD